MELTLSLMGLLLFKHFLIDFPLQGPYMYLNKGTWMHPGGICHAILHGAFTTVVLLFFVPVDPHLYLEACAALGLFDIVIHYLIDYAKVNINKKYGWTPTTSPQFWTLTGLDQFMHQLTYVLITYVFIKHVL